MAGYSGTPLLKHLGIKPDQRLLVEGCPVEYSELVGELPDGATLLGRAAGGIDLVHLFTKSAKELAGRLAKVRPAIEQDGVIWVSWPKKSAKVATDLTEDVVRDLALPLGLVDIKVCAVDETWSGLKLMIRKELRTK
jgi:hypothetical protein